MTAGPGRHAGDAPVAAAPPLRAAVLAGRFFGLRAATGTEEALAGFLTETDRLASLRRWFGPGGLRAAIGKAADRTTARARLEEAVDRDIARLDALVSAQVDALLHHARLRRLEGSWRGLRWLAEGVPPGARVRLRVLQARWHEICRDLERAVEFDQSQLFRKVYEEEFGRPGGEPFGLLAADYEIRHAPPPRQAAEAAGAPQTNDAAALGGLAGIAAAAFAPTVLGASPALLGLDDLAEAGPVFDPADALRSPDHARLRAAQARPDTRFVALALPRLLGRAPHAEGGRRADRFRYRERAPDAAARVWISSVYALAAVAVRAFARHGWPADVRGAEPGEEPTGGTVVVPAWERLPSDPSGAEAPPRPPLELAFTDLQERQLAEAGLVPLAGLEGLPEAAFAAVPSFHRPPRMAGAAADANQRLSAQFNTMLCVSRIAHCVKIMGRDMVGAYRTAEEIETALQRWLARLTSSMLSGPETAARYPLLDARVEVREHPGRPGVFGCIVHLQPHYQLDEVGAAFRLVTDLQAPRIAA